MIDFISTGGAALLGVGLGVGWASTRTGFGAGLALPLLALLGMPLPAAWMAIKLPVAASDAAAFVGEQALARSCGLPAPPSASAGAAVLACMAGAAATALAWGQVGPGGWLVWPLLVGLLWWLRGAGPRSQALAWGAYVGGVGIGAAALWRLSRCTETAADLGHAWRAAANTGAVLVLFGLGQATTPDVWVLALGQASGAWLAARGVRTRGQPGEPCATLGFGPGRIPPMRQLR